MEEPKLLSATITELAQQDTRIGKLARVILTAGNQQADRRARVLKHDDLARRLTDELGYTKPQRWTGYIPPRLWPLDDDGELLRSSVMGKDGTLTVRFNQHGRRSCGTQVNDAPARAILVDIAAEAMRRETGEHMLEAPTDMGA